MTKSKDNAFAKLFNTNLPVDLIKGNKLTIVIQDSDSDQKFGSTGTTVKAINELIASLQFKFELEDDPSSFDKRMISILSEIGEKIKLNCSFEEEMSNIQVVLDYITSLLEERNINLRGLE